ncbi:MAG TPA: vWA domain-containing protein [Polyangiaceae bacterium]|nr:vWA domain-containing protein [Polyangiaceae bacterium]
MRSFKPRPYVVLCALFTLGCAQESIDNTGFGSPSTGGSTGAGATGVPGGGVISSTGGSATSTGGTTTINVPTAMPGGGAPPVDKCVGTSSTTTPLPPVLAFLIDISNSMSRAPDGAAAGTPTKWVSTRDALVKAFTDMAEGTGTGLLYFPNAAINAMPCFNGQVAVPIAPLTMTQRQSILMSLRTTQPNGHTPTHDAYRFALQTVEASTLPGAKYVVLVTDGSPTFSLGCIGDGMTSVDASPIVQEAAGAFTRGIKTFVIGSPGSEASRASLSQIATQGGTPLAGCSDAGPNYCHFDMTTAPDLSAALNAAFMAITGQVVSCSYSIPPPMGSNVIDPTMVNVNLTSGSGQVTAIPRDTSNMPCTQGWQFSADQTQIVLCSDTCAQIKTDMSAKVDVVLGCKQITK